MEPLTLDIRRATTADLNRYCGGPESGRSALGNPSKMPGKSYGLPAAACITGTPLRGVAGTVCEFCYAHEHGRYIGDTIVCQYRRLESITRPQWADAMAELIRRSRCVDFRWHDSGDLQSLEHLLNICRIARKCPEVSFWIPTREYRIIAEFRRNRHKVPANLTVRVSAHMIGGRTPNFGRSFPVSTVSRDDSTYPRAFQCPARFQGNQCGDCRACWNRKVRHTNYHFHY